MSESVCACEHTSQTFHSLAALIDTSTSKHQLFRFLSSPLAFCHYYTRNSWHNCT